MFESELLTQGFSTLLNNPQALLFATFGVMLGIVIGAQNSRYACRRSHRH